MNPSSIYHCFHDVPKIDDLLLGQAGCGQRGTPNQSCKKYRNVGTTFPENSKTWQKKFQQNFMKKDITTIYFAISSITEQSFLNFSTVDQKFF